jgi:hypothetical protein
MLPFVPRDVTINPGDTSPAIELHADREVRPRVDDGHPSQPPRSQPGAWTAPIRTVPPPRCFFDLSTPNWRCALSPSEGGDPARSAAAPEAAVPRVTPGRVLTAVRELGLPRLRVTVQPGGETLVNLDTILHTDEPDFARTVSLLGSRVELEASPTTYTWHHGDGTTQQTSTPGAPYPSKDVVHRYSRPADRVTLRVDATYEVRFRIDGGPWQTLAETITATGPASTLVVREARPVLTAP